MIGVIETLKLESMNADLYTVLFLLAIIGAFLAIVVGRLQMSQDDGFDSEVHDKHKAVKSLEADYAAQSEIAQRIGASMDRSEFLSMTGKNSYGPNLVEPLTAGRLYKRALAIYEAIEHVDDADESDQTYRRTVEAFGLDGSSELQRADWKTMLRIARITIHAKSHGDSLDDYRKQIDAFITSGNATLSDGGKLRMREVMSMLQSVDMQAFTEEYREFIPVIEELLLNETAFAFLSVNNN